MRMRGRKEGRKERKITDLRQYQRDERPYLDHMNSKDFYERTQYGSRATKSNILRCGIKVEPNGGTNAI
jgi:hypothetical protein